MVFGSCRKKTTTTTSTTTTTTSTPSPKRSFPLFRRKPSPHHSTSLAYLTTELDGTIDGDPLPPTPAQLSQFKSVKKSKAHVDSVFYRHRATGQKTLQSGDGVLLFAGFRDWVSRKRLRERQMRGERFNVDEDTEGLVKTDGENETVMISRVKRIDPVKSGFMGKKTDRDESTGCAAGVFAAQLNNAGRGEPERPLVVVTPRKEVGGKGGVIGCNADDSTAATVCSPLSSSGSVERPVVDEDGWCGAFSNTSLSTSSPQTVPKDEEEVIRDDYSESASATAAEEEAAGWCSVFNSSAILAEEEGEFEATNDEVDDDDDDDDDDDSEDEDDEFSVASEKISGIRNVEVVYSEKKSRQNEQIEI